ncbi:hypothetical protein Daus18300_008802 [Diaporthe australafricana]|uniref:AB hydrolase-1 domain-containing protein n=1 Tax=Diaporthe australafricana TaxID=127596 RepID=A0ABR3WGN0_9PEZI
MRASAAWPSAVLRYPALGLPVLLQHVPLSRACIKKTPDGTVESTARPQSPETARYHRTVTLPDGRTLAWAEAGEPTGFPLFLFHGFPGSRLEARGVDDLGRRHNVRFIAPDRPGYGRSTLQPGRRITDWPSDVRHLARHLDVGRYGVLGGSGGGPYALACADAIPSGELASVGLLCSAAPWEAGTRGLPWSARLGSYAAAYFPSVSVSIIDFCLDVARRLAASKSGQKMLDDIAVKAAATAGKVIPESEKTTEAVAARRERLLAIFLEPFAQGSRGFVHEAYLLSQPYGFRPEDVSYDGKIHVWHGTADKNSPIRMVRWMSERLPNCELHEFEGETHFTIMKHLEDIIPKLAEDR